MDLREETISVYFELLLSGALTGFFYWFFELVSLKYRPTPHTSPLFWVVCRAAYAGVFMPGVWYSVPDAWQCSLWAASPPPIGRVGQTSSKNQ